MCERCNYEIEYDEINRAVKKLKEGMSSSVDEVALEYLERSGEVGLKWLMKVFNGCFRERKVYQGSGRVHGLYLCIRVEVIALSVLTIGE